jgi:hypothetical protein
MWGFQDEFLGARAHVDLAMDQRGFAGNAPKPTTSGNVGGPGEGFSFEGRVSDVESFVGDLLASGGAVEGDSEALAGPDSVQVGGEGKEEERGEHGRTP